MESILKSWATTIRFIVIVIIILIVINRIINNITNFTEFNINYDTDKTLVTFVDKKNIISNSVLPACDCWIDTGIEIRPDEEYEIKVSGKIHATADKLIEDASSDVLPRYNWIDSEGDKFKFKDSFKPTTSENLRKNLLLFPKANVGRVLFYFYKEGEIRPNCKIDNLQLPDTTKIIKYDLRGVKGKNTQKTTLYLWASVNDMLIRKFDKDTRLAYLNGKNDSISFKETVCYKKSIKKLNDKWNELKESKYNRIWFDDNIGQFVISAKISKPVPIYGFW